MHDTTTSGDILPLLLVGGFVATLLYFVPLIVACARSRPNIGGIAIVNLLVGWTVVGWIVALVMACVPNEQRMVVTHR